MTVSRTSRFLSWAAATGLSLALPVASARAIIVYDPSNYVQNALQAARTLQQITNQIQSLQNQAMMIEHMARNLDPLDFSALARMSASLQQIQQLMSQAQGIGFQVEQTEQRLRDLFPGSGSMTSTDVAAHNASARLQAVMAAFQDSMTLQSRIVAEAGKDASDLSDLVNQSQAARGNLQVSQATNQLLALVAKQQIQLQALLASQARADAMERATHTQSTNDAQAATRRFLGNGSAYTPQ